MEDSKLVKKTIKNGLTDDEPFNTMMTTGFFVLIFNMDRRILRCSQTTMSDSL